MTAALLLASACGAGEATAGGSGAPGGAEPSPLVLTTTTIWADVVSNVVCDGSARVEAVMPPGSDAHTYEPSLSDRDRMQDAAIVVSNGLGLEGPFEAALESVEADGVPVFRVGDHVDSLVHAGDDHSGGAVSHSHDDGEVHEAGDPHLYLDPLLVSQALDEIAPVLVAEAGLDAEAVARCVEDYQDRLAEVDAEVRAEVERLAPERRLLVTNHRSFDSFASRYGFDVLGAVLPSSSTLAETNPAALEDLARTMGDAGVPAVFVEVGSPAVDAEALAQRVGDLQVVELYTESLGEPGSGAETYLGLLRTNTGRIVDALARG